MTDRLAATRGRVVSRGQKPCGCGWNLLSSGVVHWLTRCVAHAPMCRSIESWEVDLPDEVEPSIWRLDADSVQMVMAIVDGPRIQEQDCGAALLDES